MIYAFDTVMKNEYNQGQTDIVSLAENVLQGL